VNISDYKNHNGNFHFNGITEYCNREDGYRLRETLYCLLPSRFVLNSHWLTPKPVLGRSLHFLVSWDKYLLLLLIRIIHIEDGNGIVGRNVGRTWTNCSAQTGNTKFKDKNNILVFDPNCPPPILSKPTTGHDPEPVASIPILTTCLNVNLSFLSRSSKWSFSGVTPTRIFVCFSRYPTWSGYSTHWSLTSSSLGPNIFLIALFSYVSNLYFFPQCKRRRFTPMQNRWQNCYICFVV